MTIKARNTRTANKKTIKRAPKPGTTPTDRRLLAQAEREDGEAKPPQPTPYALTGAAFDGGEDLRADCTPADLFRLMFDAPNARGGLLEHALACVSDDLELVQAAVGSDLCLEDVIVRVTQRNHFRIKVALEVARRMAEVQS